MKSKLESTQIIPPLTRPLFTKRKFLSFPIIQQHKKCSELLKEAYLFSSQRFLDHYNDIQNWMGEYGIENLNTEEVSNRYHRHLQMSEQSVSEHDLLPNIRQSDKSFPLCKP